ncbi:hypothetical protein M405DRAFT_830362 [Rhizopogon salebrosus TDB-379]|nr:hypothetical protein M405DRAFT_830362 [Rhizopogon salebrosus TDB-379]
MLRTCLNFGFQTRRSRSHFPWFIRYLRWSLDTAYGRMVEPTVFAALPAVFKQEDPDLLTSFKDTFWIF